MSLARLIYYSRPCPENKDRDVDAILASSLRRNPARHVTGMLLSHPDYFIQVLEGGEQAVTETFVRIAADPRHRSVTMVMCEEIRVRQFGCWAMRRIAAATVDRTRLLAFSANEVFDPATVSPDGLRALCVFLAGQPLAPVS